MRPAWRWAGLVALLAAGPRVEAGRVEGVPGGQIVADGGVALHWEQVSITAEAVRFDPATGWVEVVGEALVESPFGSLAVTGLRARLSEEGGWHLAEGGAEGGRIVVYSGRRYVPDLIFEGGPLRFEGGDWVIAQSMGSSHDPVHRGSMRFSTREVRIMPRPGRTVVEVNHPRVRMFGVTVFSWGRYRRSFRDEPEEGGLPGLRPVADYHEDTGWRGGVAFDGWRVGPLTVGVRQEVQEHGEPKGSVSVDWEATPTWTVFTRWGSEFGSDPFGDGQWTRESPRAGLRLSTSLGRISVTGFGAWNRAAPEGDGRIEFGDAGGRATITWGGGRREWRAWVAGGAADAPGPNWSYGTAGVMEVTSYSWGDLGLGAVLLSQGGEHPVPTRRLIESKGPIGTLLWALGGGWGVEALGRYDFDRDRFAEGRVGVLKTIRGLSVGAFWDTVRENAWVELRFLAFP